MKFIAIDNDTMPYAWGVPGGISELLGRESGESAGGGTEAGKGAEPSGSGPAQVSTGVVEPGEGAKAGARAGTQAGVDPATAAGPEAELWLGAHHRSPTLVVDDGADWPNLVAWEEDTGGHLPFLMKILAAAQPLSLQAHPTAEQAEAGFAREEQEGIARDAAERNYKDPRPKPEMIVALADGFEALCGFRDPEETLGLIGRARAVLGETAVGLTAWAEVLTSRGLKETVGWLLSGEPAIAQLLDELRTAAEQLPEDLALVPRLLADYPDDPGAAVALMLNYQVLQAGEALWLPAGNIHAYLAGMGVELMGPSDNVLRGGLTSKHIDIPELLEVLDATPGPASRLVPVEETAGVRVYRTSSDSDGHGADFELVEITSSAEIQLQGPSVLAVIHGQFQVGGASGTFGDGGACVAGGDASLQDAEQGEREPEGVLRQPGPGDVGSATRDGAGPAASPSADEAHGGSRDRVREAPAAVRDLGRGDFIFSPEAGRLRCSGSGLAFLATPRRV